VFANCANGFSDTITIRKISVRPASRMLSAISFGVLRRAAPSTSAIMRSRKDLPGSWVISTLMWSDSTRVPPVTALRSPPDSRMTGADSPVIADSSTEAMPSTTVPSPGSPRRPSTSTTSPLRSSDAARALPSASRAVVSDRIARSVAAWARPRPSASASARFANTTVSHSHTVTVNGEPRRLVAAAERRAAEDLDQPRDRGDHGADLDHEHHRVADLHARSSFTNDWPIAGHRMSGVNSDFERAGVRGAGAVGGVLSGGRHRSSASFRVLVLTPGSPRIPSERRPCSRR